jgi:membrane-associated phospholipid phosphatase
LQSSKLRIISMTGRLIAMILLAASASAATDSTRSVVDLVAGEVEQLPHHLAAEPVPSVAASVGSVAAIVWLSGADQAIRSAVQAHRTSTLDAVASVGTTSGQAWSGAALAVALMAGGAVTGSTHTQTTGRQMLEALAVAGALTTAIKVAVGRARPFRNQGDGWLLPFRWDDGQWSFPSGHATVASTIAGIALARSSCWLVRGAAIGYALLVGASRIYTDNHWTSDVLMGSAIGGLVGYSIARHNNDTDAWLLYPVPHGIALSRTW